MILALHIIVACASLGVTGYVFFRPSKSALQLSAALIAGTLISGTYLVIANPAHMMETCVMGLVFIGATTLGTVVARQKLAAQSIRMQRDR